MFFIAATNLGRSLAISGRAGDLSTYTPVDLVARNCRLAWEYGVRERQMALAVQAY